MGIPNKLPRIPPKLFNIPCTIKVNEEISEEGEPQYSGTFEGNCIFVDKAKQVMNAEKQIIQLEGLLILPGDIFPTVDIIASGEVLVKNRTYHIYRSHRPHNPDGSVHHTEIEVM